MQSESIKIPRYRPVWTMETQIPKRNSYSWPTNIASMTRMGVLRFQIADFQGAQQYFLLSFHQLQQWHFPTCSSRGAHSRKSRTGSKDPSYYGDCDEGVHAFSDIIIFDEAESSIMEIVLTIHFNIAQTYLFMNKHDDSFEWYRRTLSLFPIGGTCKTEYVSLHNFACCCYQMEDLAMSSEYFARACKLLQDLGLSDDFIATQTYHSMGVVLFHLNKPDSDLSLKLFQRSLQLYDCNPQSYTPTELSTLLNNFGRVLYSKGELQDAKRYYQLALALRRSELGNASIDVAATIYNLANTYHKEKKYQQAMDLYAEFLCIMSNLGFKTWEVAFANKCLGEVFNELKKPDLALQYYEKAFRLSMTSPGDHYREISCILNKAGNLCFEHGRYEDALKYYELGLENENKHQEDESLTFVTLTNIAQTHKQLGRYEMALTYYREAFRIQVRAEKPSREVAATLSGIGLMLYHLQRYEAALDTYQEALRLKRDSYDTDDHIDIAATLNAIGLVLFKLGIYELCMKCFMECLQIRQKLYGPEHAEVSMALYNLASVSFETGDNETALQRYEEALRVERHSLGDAHPDIIVSLVHFGQVQQQCGILNESIKTFKEALRVHQLQSTKDSTREARIYNFLGNCYLQKGDIANMMNSFSSASRVLITLRCVEEPLAIKWYVFYRLSKLHPESAAAA